MYFIKMKLLILLIVILSYCGIYCVNVRIDPLVLTKQGLVRGERATDGDYSNFLGIRYARVDPDHPFGENLPPENFSEIFNAYDDSSKCPQGEFELNRSEGKKLRYEGSIDCLRLNIYVPSVASTTNRLPVMVWIHGGAFAFGSAGTYKARDIVRHNVILVTMNYRLGPYGFMCLDVPTVPGNQGLKDQLSALRWIRDNIAVFGGNANDVTVAGQSAGGTSIDLHIFSPHEKLFNKAIIQSGTSQVFGNFVEGDESAASKLATHLGFNTDDTSQALDFLASASPDLVIGAALDLNLQMRPCKERSFSGITNFIANGDPFTFYAPAKLNNLPVMIGHTNKELFSYGVRLNVDLFVDIFTHYMIDNFDLDEDEMIEAADILRRFYIGDKAISTEVFLELEAAASDMSFNHPTQRTMNMYLQQGASPVFQYLFSYTGRSLVKNITGVGASHSEELQYLFAFDNGPEFSAEDQLVSDRMTTLWTNFVKYGNPTPQETDSLPITWLPVTTASRHYLLIDSNLKLDSRNFNDRMAFWDLFFITYGKNRKLVQKCGDFRRV